MAPIEMRNLTTFPIERLCFDLKVEVLEQLEARDVIELVKVNQGFQWMISNRPSIVFGPHVNEIGSRFEELNIKMFEEQKLNSASRMSLSLDVIIHLSFIQGIRSCDLLWMSKYYDSLLLRDKRSRYQSFTMKALRFQYRQNIDTTKDWIYMLFSNQLLAFYVKRIK